MIQFYNTVASTKSGKKLQYASSCWKKAAIKRVNNVRPQTPNGFTQIIASQCVNLKQFMLGKKSREVTNKSSPSLTNLLLFRLFYSGGSESFFFSCFLFFLFRIFLPVTETCLKYKTCLFLRVFHTSETCFSFRL